MSGNLNNAAIAAGTGVTEWDARVSLVEAMAEKDINVDINDVIIDGKLHRIYIEGDDKGTENGFYTAHFDDRPAGIFGCNKRYGYDVKHAWSMKVKRAPMSAEERRAYMAKKAADRERREAEAVERHKAAAELANRIWNEATLVAGNDHEYLAAKGVQSHGLRVGKWAKFNPDTGDRDVIENALLIPIKDSNKNIVSLQAILPDAYGIDGRNKDYLAGGDKSGRFFPIGQPKLVDGKVVVVIAEGYATGATIHEATGYCTIVAFDAPNLEPVARAISKILPDATIVLAGDNDQWTYRPVKNPGIVRAMQAAAAVGGHLAFPMFDASLGVPNEAGKIKGPTDFNDLAMRESTGAVVDAIADALSAAPVTQADAQAALAGSIDDEEPAKAVPQVVRDAVSKSVAAAESSAKVALELAPARSLAVRPKIEMEKLASGLMYADARDGMFGRPLTEVGNAERLHDLHGDVLRYCPEAAAWLHWDNGCWSWDTDSSKTRQLAMDLRGSIYDEGRNNLDQAEHFVKWARKSGERRTIENAVKLLSDRWEMRVPLSYIDGDHLLMGVDGGRQVVDLRTGTVRAAHQSDMVTKSAGVRGVGDESKAVLWKKFLDDVFLGDQEMIGWMQRMLGYALTGSTREQFFVFAFGKGANGKGVMMSVMREVWGDYYRTISSDTLMEQRRPSAGPSPELAALVGARLVVSGETEQGCALSESLVKLLTGEDMLPCRHLYGKPFEYMPQFKIFMAGNHKPTVRGTDNGIWRRVRMVPFERIFAEHEKDKSLASKLLAEREHIFAWLLAGCIKWQEQGLGDQPSAIKSATNEYQREEDVIGQWLDDCCAVGPGQSSRARELYLKYRAWAEEGGYRPLSEVKFNKNLVERRGISSEKDRTGKCYKGVSALF
ncbi:MAG: toprim domain-containing protein [Paraburkholderia sp.]|uniref:phage/plasmid primase, P4 family n=1 Tax=Paraburkholderia sp. TaxID=1926495 RepID=UPI00121494BC|nr:phage/plasmid primase, P4 family [Paraburkholderia sp.]TAM06383.1 MAG: toprim domain-containing protein [Paraburkholderia sp.]